MSLSEFNEIQDITSTIKTKLSIFGICGPQVRRCNGMILY